MRDNILPTNLGNEKSALCDTIRAYASVIAHDQRSPISCINMAAGFYKNMLPILEDASKGKPIHGLQIKEFREWLEVIDESTIKMGNIIDNALKNIDTLFNNQNCLSNQLNLTECSIADSLSPEALKLLFITNNPRLVHIDIKHNFNYMGNKTSIDQVITNILNNAFYQIRKNNKGEIYITTETLDDVNTLHIKDTAGGASPEIVNNMFNASYTTKPDGNGVGLNFCKQIMQLLGGDITAHAKYQHYMEFILVFPKI